MGNLMKFNIWLFCQTSCLLMELRQCFAWPWCSCRPMRKLSWHVTPLSRLWTIWRPPSPPCKLIRLEALFHKSVESVVLITFSYLHIQLVFTTYTISYLYHSTLGACSVQIRKMVDSDLAFIHRLETRNIVGFNDPQTCSARPTFIEHILRYKSHCK